VTITRALLTSDSVTFDGKFFKVHEASLVARAVQKPSPPIWIGASADPAIRRAARLGDAWSMSGHTPVNELIRQQGLYREELAKLNLPLPPERPINRVVYIAEDRDTAFEEAMPHFVEQYRKRGAVGWFQSRDEMQRALEAGEMHWIVGDPQGCYEQLKRIEETIGATQAIFTMPVKTDREKWLRTIRLLGEEVLPKFGRHEPNVS
jgi:alkanesulfonate monooxygenase SsuD/methylene tetrahydromethanopterin reductase-like flavin-dependent oxidoreductase (luciferase family)